MIERIGPDFGGASVYLDPVAMTVAIYGQVEAMDVRHVIPVHKAGHIVQAAGLTEGDWAPVNAIDLSSKMDEAAHVLGDAAAQADMPKSGFSANSQAKVCANAVLGAPTGARVFPARFSNTCWSLIDTDDGVKVGATYEPTEKRISNTGGFFSQTGEVAEVRAATFRESLGGTTRSPPTCSAPDIPPAGPSWAPPFPAFPSEGPSP